MYVGSRVRAVRRRVRCARRGHYWVQRLSPDTNVEVFCRRCGRVEASVRRDGRST